MEEIMSLEFKEKSVKVFIATWNIVTIIIMTVIKMS